MKFIEGDPVEVEMVGGWFNATYIEPIPNGHRIQLADPRCDKGAKGVRILADNRIRPREDDNVNHPSHYKWLPVEAIDITEHFNFCMGNALKYIIRADHKGNPLEDLKKAEFYICREIKRREMLQSDTRNK